VLRREARCLSSSCSLDSSIRHEVRLHRRVARRIDVPPSSGYVYRSCDWKIYQIHWIKRCIVKDRAKQSSSSWYQSARLITMQLFLKRRGSWHLLHLGELEVLQVDDSRLSSCSCVSAKIDFLWIGFRGVLRRVQIGSGLVDRSHKKKTSREHLDRASTPVSPQRGERLGSSTAFARRVRPGAERVRPQRPIQMS
jgi:hypothetical protein